MYLCVPVSAESSVVAPGVGGRGKLEGVDQNENQHWINHHCYPETPEQGTPTLIVQLQRDRQVETDKQVDAVNQVTSEPE